MRWPQRFQTQILHRFVAWKLEPVNPKRQWRNLHCWPEPDGCNGDTLTPTLQGLGAVKYAKKGNVTWCAPWLLRVSSSFSLLPGSQHGFHWQKRAAFISLFLVRFCERRIESSVNETQVKTAQVKNETQTQHQQRGRESESLSSLIVTGTAKTTESTLFVIEVAWLSHRRVVRAKGS
ncbi:hypothetical protein O9929_28305 [Vibrio lentus]|nr:hypothetical protein [Vibrio lentus]